MSGKFCVLVGIVVAFSLSSAHAQDNNNPDELKKALADTQGQLKAAQDRAAMLAQENEQLKTRVGGLEKEAADLRRDQSTFAERTFFLRAHYSAWQRFVERYPQLAMRWKLFLAAEPVSVGAEANDLFGGAWPEK